MNLQDHLISTNDLLALEGQHGVDLAKAIEDLRREAKCRDDEIHRLQHSVIELQHKQRAERLGGEPDETPTHEEVTGGSPNGGVTWHKE